MHHLRRTLLPLLLLASLTACGVRAGDAAPDVGSDRSPTAGADREPDTDPEPDDEPSAFDQQMIDAAAENYEAMGLDPEDAECLAAGMVDLMADASGGLDQATIVGLMTDCELSMADLTQLTETMAEGGGVEDAVRNSLILSLTNGGYAEAVAECVADAYLDEYGTADVEAITDPQVVQGLVAGCRDAGD